jgi:hypothetical protein
MDVVENVVDGDTILDQVDPENRDIFREIFLNDDSEEEFLGFDRQQRTSTLRIWKVCLHSNMYA